jgi:hypothetical protein
MPENHPAADSLHLIDLDQSLRGILGSLRK